LRLRFVEDLSAAEIARVLQRTSPFVVYRRLGKLLETLRGALKRRGIEDGVA
jgi:DNA-directed RNA polymerase specialized sigma24 family protein